MSEKRRATTFRTSRGAIVYVEAPEIYIPPMLTEDQVRDALNDELRAYSVDPSEREKRRLFWREDMENYAFVKCLPFDGAGLDVSYTNAAIPAFEGDYVLAFQHATQRSIAVRSPYFSQIARNQKLSVELRWYVRSYFDSIELALWNHDETGTGPFGVVSWHRSRPDGTPGWALRICGGGSPVYLSDAREGIGSNTWAYLKLGLDYQNNRYDRLQTTLLDIDLTSTPLVSRTHTPSSVFFIAFAASINAAATLPYPAYLDDIRLYLNEV